MFNGQSRIIGTEIEFGIATPEAPLTSPILTSTAAVMAYADTIGLGARRARWDYEPESPLRDTRGFDLRRYAMNHAPVLDPNAMGAANVILPSGARFYVDHAHPEYSSPEVTNAMDAVIWDKAGETVMQRAAEAATAAGYGEQQLHAPIKVYKNNVDGKGASYGAHENYLYSRHTDIDAVHTGLMPFFVTRQVFTGSGRVGLGMKGETPGYQLSQRADYIETTISLETTLNRGIINTRDEPHAPADDWRRLHVIIGDANLSEYSTFLKVGTTSLVLDAIEAGVDFSHLELEDPVGDVARVSRDLTCTQLLRLADRRTELTAIEIQREYLKAITAAEGTNGLSFSDTDRQVLALWEEILSDLERDPASTADRLDWSAKLALLEGYRARGLDWSDPRMALIDLQYSDCDPAKSLYQALVRRGRIRTLVDPQAVAAALDTPPADTRAYLRGHLVSRFSRDIVAANWDNVVITPAGAGQPMRRIHLDRLLGATQAETQSLLESASSVHQLADELLRTGVCTLSEL